MKKFDWIEFIIHAFFGFILGCFAGCTVGLIVDFFWDINLYYATAIGGLVYAVVAGVIKDELWTNLGR